MDKDSTSFPTLSRQDSLPTISVVSVVIRDPNGLERTLRSLTRADARFELVVVDGDPLQPSWQPGTVCPRERGLRIVRVCGSDDGPYDAMNRGIVASSGTWLWFVNAGDEVAPETDLDELVTRLEETSHSWAVGSVLLVDGDDTSINPPATSRQILRGETSQCHQGMFVHRKALMVVGSFDKRYRIAADYRMMCDLARIEEPLVLDYVVAWFHRGGLSSVRRRRLYLETFAARLAARTATPGWHLVDLLRMLRRILSRPGVVSSRVRHHHL